MTRIFALITALSTIPSLAIALPLIQKAPKAPVAPGLKMAVNGVGVSMAVLPFTPNNTPVLQRGSAMQVSVVNLGSSAVTIRPSDFWLISADQACAAMEAGAPSVGHNPRFTNSVAEVAPGEVNSPRFLATQGESAAEPACYRHCYLPDSRPKARQNGVLADLRPQTLPQGGRALGLLRFSCGDGEGKMVLRLTPQDAATNTPTQAIELPGLE